MPSNIPSDLLTPGEDIPYGVDSDFDWMRREDLPDGVLKKGHVREELDDWIKEQIKKHGDKVLVPADVIENPLKVESRLKSFRDAKDLEMQNEAQEQFEDEIKKETQDQNKLHNDASNLVRGRTPVKHKRKRIRVGSKSAQPHSKEAR
mmetsp:Transcript_21729/g.35098  ORF Transcript_21729/g.35098 Transcript_21729/m.35098 type:complete len:148 (+) Transcript_21729:131-574(+)